ncbi:MAG: hypothetical protein AABY39_10385, partial [Nitrospirota bacterium]
DVMAKAGLDEARLDMVVGWLSTKGVLTISETGKNEIVSLTDIGKRYAAAKIPEFRIVNELKEGKKFTIKDLQQRGDMEPTEISSAIGGLKEAGIISIIEGGYLQLIKDVQHDSEIGWLQTTIEVIAQSKSVPLEKLGVALRDTIQLHHRKRGKAKGIFRIQEKIKRRFELTEEGKGLLQAIQKKGASYITGTIALIETISQITPAMLKDGSWRRGDLRKYDISLPAPRITTGRKHPYREFLDFTKYKLVSMGFEEMRGPLVEAEFWNNDALYMPQFHPARDIHDGYFLSEPSHAKKIEEPFLKNVKAVHQSGGKAKSKGWRYHFSEERAKQLVLRSQGTAVSARRLAGKPNIPGKYF